MKHIVRVEPLPGYNLKLRFDDGAEGVVDLSAEAGKEIFAPWREPKQFHAVRIAHGGRSLEWPGEIDLCSDALYLEVTGGTLDNLFPACETQNAHA
jgi:hypothetical protein